MKPFILGVVVVMLGASCAMAKGKEFHKPQITQTKSVNDLSARRHHKRHSRPTDANGNIIRKVKREARRIGLGVVRSAAGAVAWVQASLVPKFQGYINDLEAAGARITFMGGIRPGRCSPGSQHPCGKAIDVCQYARDVVDKRCHLPGRAVMAQLARKNGLHEGGEWCHGDMGHVQASDSAAPCSAKIAVARRIAREEAKVYAEAEGMKVDNGNKTKPDFIGGSTTREHSAKRHRHRHYKVRYARAASHTIEWGEAYSRLNSY